MYNWARKLSVIRSSGVSAIQGLLKYCSQWKAIGTFRIVRYIVICPLFRGCLSIAVNGRAVGTFRIVCYSGVSVKRGSTVFTVQENMMSCILGQHRTQSACAYHHQSVTVDCGRGSGSVEGRGGGWMKERKGEGKGGRRERRTLV